MALSLISLISSFSFTSSFSLLFIFSITGLLLYLALLLATLFITRDDPIRKLSLSSKATPLQTIVQGVGLAVAAFIITLLLALFLNVFSLNDGEKINAIITTLPLLSIVIAVSIGPIAEELFFRGFLQKRIGIILSSVVFAVLHYTYGSVMEIAGAFLVSVLFGYWSKKSKSIQPAIIAHILYNLLSILIVLSKSG